MAESTKPTCKYGSSCYRKNPQHLQQFSHPEPAADAEAPTQQSDDKTDTNERKRVRESSEDTLSVVSKHKKPPETPDTDGGINEIHKKVKEKFLVQMPEDFYHFWEFCCSLEPNDPLNALVGTLQLALVGPFHVLAGKLEEREWSDCVLHYRFYYDPPEMVTVLNDVGGNTGYHIGYYRDDPSSTDTFMVSNVCSAGCVLSHAGLNLFAAVRNEVQKKLKGNKKELSKQGVKDLHALDGLLIKKATELGHNIKDIKPSGRKIVAKCFNGIGLSVPMDEKLEIGYRPLPKTNKELRRLLDKIASCDKEKERDIASEPLQEIITYVQFANDECDYGMGLELGTDLFCYGSEFNDQTQGVLPLAYELLERKEFGTIVKTHLSNRQLIPLDFTTT